jgi:hypothetical protein
VRCRCRRRSGHRWGGGDTSPTSPMTMAAMIGPTRTVGERRLGRLDRGGDPLLGVAQLVVEADQVRDQLGGDSVSGGGNRPGRLELVEQTGSLSCADLAGEPTRCQLTQHGVQPGGQPGAVPGQVTVTFRPHLHHLGVVVDENLRHR